METENTNDGVPFVLITFLASSMGLLLIHMVFVLKWFGVTDYDYGHHLIATMVALVPTLLAVVVYLLRGKRWLCWVISGIAIGLFLVPWTTLLINDVNKTENSPVYFSKITGRLSEAGPLIFLLGDVAKDRFYEEAPLPAKKRLNRQNMVGFRFKTTLSKEDSVPNWVFFLLRVIDEVSLSVSDERIRTQSDCWY